MLLYFEFIKWRFVDKKKKTYLLQVPLYAEFDRSKLLPFLRNSNYYPLQKVRTGRLHSRVVHVLLVCSARNGPLIYAAVLRPIKAPGI